jgi:hypothetical protein
MCLIRECSSALIANISEARLHETMLDLVGSHTSAKFNTVPSRVLDVSSHIVAVTGCEGLRLVDRDRAWSLAYRPVAHLA